MKKITFLFLLTGFWVFGQDFVDATGGLPQLIYGFSAWGDYDGDGDLDLFFTGQLNANSNGGGLYENDNGNFTLVTNSGLPLYSMGEAKWGDTDNDGDLDLVVMGYAGNAAYAKVFVNNGNGTFTDAGAGLPDIYIGYLDLGDVNGDGLLDIALTGFDDTNNVDLAKIYINNGNNNFTELTSASLPPVNYGKIKFVDYDADGDLDITLAGFSDLTYVAYTKVWENDGSQNFTEKSLGLPQLWLGDFEWGDVDGDGDLDFVIIGTASSDSEAHLMINDNNTFTDDPHFANITGAHRVSSLEMADYNNDGSLDIFLTGMNVAGGAENIVANLYENNGSGIFTENTNVTFTGVNYSDADAADYDNDGKVDIFVTGADANNFGVAKLYHNEYPDAVSEVLATRFDIYPNPAHNVVNIENHDNFNYMIGITDLTGKIVLNKSASGSVHIDVSNLPTGMYLIKISDQQNSFVKKIVIK